MYMYHYLKPGDRIDDYISKLDNTERIVSLDKSNLKID